MKLRTLACFIFSVVKINVQSRVREIIHLDHLQYHFIVQRTYRDASEPPTLQPLKKEARLIQGILARVRSLLIEIDLFSHYMSLPNDDLRLAGAKVLDAQMPESSNSDPSRIKREPVRLILPMR